MFSNNQKLVVAGAGVLALGALAFGVAPAALLQLGLLALCPLMMLFMHGGHGGHSDKHDRNDSATEQPNQHQHH